MYPARQGKTSKVVLANQSLSSLNGCDASIFEVHKISRAIHPLLYSPIRTLGSVYYFWLPPIRTIFHLLCCHANPNRRFLGLRYRFFN